MDIDWRGVLDVEILMKIRDFKKMNTTTLSEKLLYLLLKENVRKTFENVETKEYFNILRNNTIQNMLHSLISKIDRVTH